jgi:hypothetical protein
MAIAGADPVGPSFPLPDDGTSPRREMEFTQAVQEFTAFVNQLRRDDLTEVEIAALRSLFEELKTHLQF